MKFQTIFENFKGSANGTDAYKQLKVQCEQSLKNSDQQLEYSSLLLIYGFAKNYVLLYEDQAVTSEFAEKVKDQLVHYMSDLNKALLTRDSAKILDSLNSISKEYIASSRIF